MKSVLIAFVVMLSYATIAQTPAGEIIGPTQLSSSVYPGTTRNYWVYVPKQYNAAVPACLMVVQDGLSRATGWKLPQVLDSLIALKRIPVIIGVFVDPGTVAPAHDGAFPRFNRSFEYDALGDRYANFLINELLPEIAKTYSINPDPNARSIAGASSGAICAFNVAWERPDQFKRVLSTIGTYVGLRGGDQFTTLVRQSETKPIRVYLEDGSSDLNIYGGDWWMANQSMLSALTHAGYEVNHSWGTGGHDSKHAVTIMADALEWLWKDYPAPVTTHKGIKPRLDLLIEGEPWKEVPLNGLEASQLTVDKNGDILFTNKGKIYRVDNQLRVHSNSSKVTVDAIAAGKSQLYGWSKSTRKISAIDSSGRSSTIVSNCDAVHLYAVTGGLYFSDPLKRRIGYYDTAAKTVHYFPTEFTPGAMALSAEKTFLNVAGQDTPFGYSFRVDADHNLRDGQPYIHYHIPYGNTTPQTGGMDVDSDNVLFTSTGMGIQVSDQLGRVNFIFSKTTKSVMDVKLSGDRLFTTGDGKLFVRKVSAKGLRAFNPPSNPPKPQL